jgi:pyruvate formate lyase activating enzyme
MQQGWTRREFLTRCALAGAGACAFAAVGRSAWGQTPPTNLREALYYRRVGEGKTQCLLCPNQCVRGRGEDGMCHARGNRNGGYYSLVYGRPCVVAMDEVEKCPLNHFQVAGKAFSIATAGCNLTCQYCQNWTFSQAGPNDVPKVYDLSPQAVVAEAVRNKAGAVAYFYTEPTVYYEYMLDTAKLARQRGLKNVMVTAGYISPEPLKALLPWVDAVTFGLKGWNEEFYRKYIGCELGHVKESVRALAASKGVWWEVVTLVLPSLNDDMGEIAAMSAWLRETAGAEVPLHLTRFRPEYRLKRLAMTPAATLTAARETAMKAGLKYVYVGNMPGHEGGDTYCPKCGKKVVERIGFTVAKKSLAGGRCVHCGQVIKGVWL